MCAKAPTEDAAVRDDLHTIHVQHADPAMSIGLHAILLAHGEWRVTLESRDPGAGGGAAVLVADYAAGVELARRADTAARVLIVTQLDKESQVRKALADGVAGYVLQSCSPDELAEAVRRLAAGRSYLGKAIASYAADGRSRIALTGRETEVLQLLAEGCCNKSIARRLGIGVGTVKTHMKGLMHKLDATARIHVVAVAARRGLIMPGEGIKL
jgi:DNA-binding NarL/FixJ family response regulator